ncbi:hypothetical protein K443DRAFT_100507 [Laccaria amethystina LaAM-08-1]|uniref:Uncharacterized protein n=1 Tax=Laccaria amethystina LaAM-08-1 TaxID=1095629 RepID=A0A0C9XFF7_9AGAR|nr:hypothetical protein K443DRAFT_100507 [Laccaria amethystina LaAM-08-1]
MHTDYVHPTPTMSTIVNTISIQPCRYYSNIVNNSYPNIVNNSLHHVYYFFSFFPDFLAIFTLLTIFGNAHRPCKQYPNNITIPSLFSF